jgi:hypothetical protein
MDERPPLPRALWIAIAVAALTAVAAALIPIRRDTLNVNIALVLVVCVVLVAAGGGRAPGAVAAVTAAVAFDFFHTQPFYRFTIDSRDDVETTALLLVVSLVVGHLAARARRARRREDMRSGEIRRIYRLAALGARGRAPTAVIAAATSELTELLGLRACRFECPPFATHFERLERSGLVSWLDSRLQTDGFELPADGVELLVFGRGRLLGRFVLDPIPGIGVSLEQRVVAVALADQVGAVLAAPATPTSEAAEL